MLLQLKSVGAPALQPGQAIRVYCGDGRAALALLGTTSVMHISALSDPAARFSCPSPSCTHDCSTRASTECWVKALSSASRSALASLWVSSVRMVTEWRSRAPLSGRPTIRNVESLVNACLLEPVTGSGASGGAGACRAYVPFPAAVSLVCHQRR